MAGGSIGGGLATVSYRTPETLAAAQRVADIIAAGLAAGAFVPVVYPGSGDVLAAPASALPGVAIFHTSTSQPVAVSPGDPYGVIDADGPVSILGGGGATVLAGAGVPGAPLNVSYTAAPSGQVTTIVITDGNNLVQGASAGGGELDVTTGSGDDSITILTGTAVVDAGTGANRTVLLTGGNLVRASGNDSITGGAATGGADTVEVTAGNTSIDGGAASFLVRDDGPGPVHVSMGVGVDTVDLARGAAAIFGGAGTQATVTGAATVTASAGPAGVMLFVTGGASTIAAGAANDRVQAASGSNWISAGSGNDTLLAGTGSDTLVGGRGHTVLVSGAGLGTTFAFSDIPGNGPDTVVGFKATDTLSFTGFGAAPPYLAVTVGGNTVYPLWDGTIVTVVAAAPSAQQIALR